MDAQARKTTAVNGSSPSARFLLPVAFQDELPPAQAIKRTDGSLPINLPTALRLAEAAPLDIAIAVGKLQVASAQHDRAKLAWLPTVYLGGDYYRHDGQLQDVAGRVFGTSKSSVMAGVGPTMVFAFTDAYFAPLAARQEVQAQSARVQATQHDSMLAVAEAYFTVQQARGELAGTKDALDRGEDLLRRAEKLAAGLIAPLEVSRIRTELARRRQAYRGAREKWQVASARLATILRLDAQTLLEPAEPPNLQVPLVPPQAMLDELMPLAFKNRPELDAQQAQLQATYERVRQEKMRPLLPSLMVRGTATNPTGSLTTGYFGGGFNSQIGNFSWRNDYDIQMVWELQNLGLGNRARVRERHAENQVAVHQLARLQDTIAGEVTQAHAQVSSAWERMNDAESGLKDALETATKTFEGLNQTRRLGDNILVLVIRPQEAVASLQALHQAYADYFGAVGDFNRSQFRLFRALGNPAIFHQQIPAENRAPRPPEQNPS